MAEAANTKIFLENSLIAGEVKFAGFEDQIGLLNVDLEINLPMIQGRARGVTNGESVHTGVKITKYGDIASPLLMGHCSAGTTIGDVTITFLRNFEGEMKLYRTITLSEVWVSRYAVAGSDQETDDMPLEEVTLDYSRIEDEFVQQTSDGAAGGSVSAIWDLKTLTSS